MKAPHNSVEKRGYPLRFLIEAEHQKKIDDLSAELEKNFGAKGSVGLVIRTLIECATVTPDFLGAMRQLYERDIVSRKGRDEKQIAISLNLEVKQEEKMNHLKATALANKVKGSAGTVIRTLLEMVEPSVDFFETMAKVAEAEKSLRSQRRDDARKAKPETKPE